MQRPFCDIDGLRKAAVIDHVSIEEFKRIARLSGFRNFEYIHWDAPIWGDDEGLEFEQRLGEGGVDNLVCENIALAVDDDGRVMACEFFYPFDPQNASSH